MAAGLVGALLFVCAGCTAPPLPLASLVVVALGLVFGVFSDEQAQP